MLLQDLLDVFERELKVDADGFGEPAINKLRILDTTPIMLLGNLTIIHHSFQFIIKLNTIIN